LKLSEKAHLLQNTSPERIRDEFFQILTASGAGASLEKLHDSGLLGEILTAGIFPENTCPAVENRGIPFEQRIANTVAAEHISSGSFYPENAAQLYQHLYREVESHVSLVSLLKLAAFLGDAEKPWQLTAKIAERLRIGGKACRILTQLCERSGNLFNRPGWNPTRRAMYRFFADREPAGLAVLILELARGNISRELGAELIDFYFGEFPAICDDILLSGDEIMAILGIGKGRQVGEAAELLKNAESAGLVNDKEQAREFLEKNLLTTKEPVL
jgi:tRNA nucleotidyltransferase/poly(A) polymerase